MIHIWRVIALLCIAGVVWCLFGRTDDGRLDRTGRLLLLALLGGPFALYLGLGLLDIRFGWFRNFFYLLPIYLLLAARGLRWLTRGGVPFGISAAVIIAVMLLASMNSVVSWRENNLERELIRRAAQEPGPVLVVQSRIVARRPSEHYRKRLGISDRTAVITPTSDHADLTSALERLSAQGQVVVLEQVSADRSSHTSYGPYPVAETRRHTVEFGPFRFVQRLFDWPPILIERRLLGPSKPPATP